MRAPQEPAPQGGVGVPENPSLLEGGEGEGAVLFRRRKIASPFRTDNLPVCAA